jgi:short-subunit dehydrogenase
MQAAGRIDVLINNAGYSGPIAASEEISDEQRRRLWETNFFGAVNMTNAVLPILRGQGEGHILMVGSMNGVIATPFTSTYSSTKFALEGYSEALRGEVAAFNIRVTLLEPGFYLTNIEQTFEAPANPIPAYERQRKGVEMLARISARRGRDPQDIGKAVYTLLEKRSEVFRVPLGSDAVITGTLKRILPYGFFEPMAMSTYKLAERVDPEADEATVIQQMGPSAMLTDGKLMDAALPYVVAGALGTLFLILARVFRRRG